MGAENAHGYAKTKGRSFLDLCSEEKDGALSRNLVLSSTHSKEFMVSQSAGLTRTLWNLERIILIEY